MIDLFHGLLKHLRNKPIYRKIDVTDFIQPYYANDDIEYTIITLKVLNNLQVKNFIEVELREEGTTSITPVDKQGRDFIERIGRTLNHYSIWASITDDGLAYLKNNTAMKDVTYEILKYLNDKGGSSDMDEMIQTLTKDEVITTDEVIREVIELKSPDVGYINPFIHSTEADFAGKYMMNNGLFDDCEFTIRLSSSGKEECRRLYDIIHPNPPVTTVVNKIKVKNNNGYVVQDSDLRDNDLSHKVTTTPKTKEAIDNKIRWYNSTLFKSIIYPLAVILIGWLIYYLITGNIPNL